MKSIMADVAAARAAIPSITAEELEEIIENDDVLIQTGGFVGVDGDDQSYTGLERAGNIRIGKGSSPLLELRDEAKSIETEVAEKMRARESGIEKCAVGIFSMEMSRTSSRSRPSKRFWPATFG